MTDLQTIVVLLSFLTGLIFGGMFAWLFMKLLG